MSKFRIRIMLVSLVIVFALVSCNLPSYLSENEPALPPTATKGTNPVPTNKPVSGTTPPAVPDVNITDPRSLDE